MGKLAVPKAEKDWVPVGSTDGHIFELLVCDTKHDYFSLITITLASQRQRERQSEGEEKWVNKGAAQKRQGGK